MVVLLVSHCSFIAVAIKRKPNLWKLGYFFLSLVGYNSNCYNDLSEVFNALSCSFSIELSLVAYTQKKELQFLNITVIEKKEALIEQYL